jgi:hypothetical protein
VGSNHSPLSHCAELTPGDTAVTIAIGANAMAAIDNRRQTNVHIAHPFSH